MERLGFDLGSQISGYTISTTVLSCLSKGSTDHELKWYMCFDSLIRGQWGHGRGRFKPFTRLAMRPGGGDVWVPSWKGGFLSSSMLVPHLGDLPSFLGALLLCVLLLISWRQLLYLIYSVSIVKDLRTQACHNSKSYRKGTVPRGEERGGPHLIATLLHTQLAQRHLRLHAAHGTLLVREPIWMRGDLDGNLRRLGQQVIEPLCQAVFKFISKLIRTVWVVTGISLLTIGHREILRAKGWVRLAASDAAMGPRTTKNQRNFIPGTTTFLTLSVNHSPGERPFREIQIQRGWNDLIWKQPRRKFTCWCGQHPKLRVTIGLEKYQLI